LREVAELREGYAHKEKHRHFGEDYIRYVAHDYRDDFGGGYCMAVMNRAEQDLGPVRLNDPTRLSPYQQYDVRQILAEKTAMERRKRESEHRYLQGIDRIKMENAYQYSDAAIIWKTPLEKLKNIPGAHQRALPPF